MAPLIERYAAMNAYWYLITEAGNALAQDIVNLNSEEQRDARERYYTILGVANRIQIVLESVRQEMIEELSTLASPFPLIDALEDASNGQVVISQEVGALLLDTAKRIAGGNNGIKR